MAGVKRSWTRPLAVAVLCGFVSMGQTAGSQAFRVQSGGSGAGSGSGSGSGGSLAGKLTDLHSAPLDGVLVVVRNEASGAEARATTARNGSYRFDGLGPGEYTLEAESAQLGRGRVEGIFVAAGHEARVQAAIQFELPQPNPIQTASHALRPVTPVVTAPAASEALQQQAVNGRVSAELMREMPTVLSLGVSATVPAEAMQELPLTGRRLPVPARLMATTVAPVLIATLVPDPLQTLPLTGHGALAAVKVESAGIGLPSGLASGSRALALREAVARMALAATQFGQFRLRVGREESFVAASHEVDPVGPVVTTTVAGEQLQQLPLSGRHWENFVLDTPTASTPAGGQVQTALRGAGQQPASATVDGAGKGLAFGGAGGSGTGTYAQGGTSENGAGQSGMEQAWAGGRGFGVAQAAIREVQTTAGNVEAAASRASGGRVNVETQRGSNGLHGQGFAYDRQNTWGAKNPFTQWVQNTGTVTNPVFTPLAYTPPDHESNWGIGLGSQIRRDKLFWFGAFDNYQRNDPGLATAKHEDQFFILPTNGDLQMQVLSARLGESTGKAYTDYLGMIENLGQLLGPAPRTAKQWVGFGRLDWEATERHRFTLEGTGALWNAAGGGLTRVAEAYGSHSFGSSKASEEWLLGRWEAFLSPNLLAVTQGSVGREILTSRPDAPSALEQKLLVGNVWGQLPQIVVDSRYGFTIGNPSSFGQGSYPDEHLYQVRESADWVHGSLLVRAGFELAHNTDATSLLRNQTGTYYYSNVGNFISDALTFAGYGLNNALNLDDQHNCDQTGKSWRDSTGTPRGLGYLPCYSYYSQSRGPTNWWLSTDDLAGYATTQWQASKLLVLSAGLRWEREQMPPPIGKVNNPELPLTQKLPSLGNNWGPRLSLALGSAETHLPVLRVGYGMYYGRTENATLETALTHTGSLSGDMNLFMRPTDDLQYHSGGAPPFPYVPAGLPGTVVKPGAVELAPNFRNSEVHQAVAAVEETLPSHIDLIVSALVSLGRRLPISIDTNIDPTAKPATITYAVENGAAAGPIKGPKITVPFYSARLNPDYQQITQVMSMANSTYEAMMLTLTRNSRRGLSVRAHYTYSHAMDWNPNETTQVAGSDVLDPANLRQEYGTSNLDVRHAAAVSVIYTAPWKLHNLAGKLANDWMVSGIGQFRGGLPYTMRTSGSLPAVFQQGSDPIEALGPGMNGSGGDNRVYGVGRNTYRYPTTWKADLRLGKSFDLGQMRKLELLAESFNLFNHQNVTQLETTGYYIQRSSSLGELPTLNFLTGLKANTTAFGQPLNINATTFYRERQIQVGLRMRF